MKKKLLVLIASITILGSITGCGDLLHGDGNVETGQTNYMLTRIENVPDGWETSKFNGREGEKSMSGTMYERIKCMTEEEDLWDKWKLN